MLVTVNIHPTQILAYITNKLKLLQIITTSIQDNQTTLIHLNMSRQRHTSNAALFTTLLMTPTPRIREHREDSKVWR